MSPPSPELRRCGPAVAAALAVAVLWAGADVVTLDVVTRLALPFVWLALWTLAAVGYGAPLAALARGRREEPPDLAVVLATGAMVLSVTATVLAAVSWLRPTALIAVLVLGAALAGGGLLTRRISVATPALAPDMAGAAAVAAAWGLLALLLTSPPVMYDTLHYHLAFPQHWLEAGRFVEFPRHLFSYYPAGHGMGYVYSLATVGPWGAAAQHWWFGAVAALAAGSLGRRIGGPRAGWWALLLFALTPATLQVADIAIADLAVAAWAGAALIVVLDSPPTPPRFALAGCLIGAAFSAKYLALATAVAPLAVAAGVVAATSPAARRWCLPALAVGAAAVAAPWLVRNTLWTGNPLYPYLPWLFGQTDTLMDVGREVAKGELIEPGLRASAWRAVTALPRRSFDPLLQGGVIGLHWVLLLPLAALVRKLERSAVAPLAAATVVGALGWGALVHFARFLLPVLVPAAAIAGVAASALTGLPSPLLRRSFHVLLLGLAAWNVTIVASEVNFQRLGVVIGALPERRFLDQWVSYSPALDFVNRELPADAVILLVAEPRSLYFQRRVLVEDSYRLPWLLELAEEATDADDLGRRLRALGVSHVVVDERQYDYSAHLRLAPDYWFGGSDAARLRATSFLSSGVERVFAHGGLWIGRVR